MAKTGNKVQTHSWGRNKSIKIQSYIIIICPIKNDWNSHNVLWRDSHNEQSKVGKVCVILTHVSLCVFMNVSMWLFEYGKTYMTQGTRILGVFLLTLPFDMHTQLNYSHKFAQKLFYLLKETRKVSLFPLYFPLLPPTFLCLHFSHLIHASTIFVSATVIAWYLFQSILHIAAGINIAT